MYDPNSVIEESNSSLTDDKLDYYPSIDYKNFQTNESHDDKFKFKNELNHLMMRKNHSTLIEG